MKYNVFKKISIYYTLIIIFYSSFLSAEFLQDPTAFRHLRKPKPLFQDASISKTINLSQVQNTLKNKSYRQFREYVTQGLGENISEKYLITLALKHQDSGLLRALKGSRALGRLSGTFLSKKERLSLSLFIENELSKYIAKKRYYITEKSANLPRTIEHDPITGLHFIHLATNKVPEIGRGYQKIVTKSILYNIKKPEVVANCKTSSNISREISLMKELKGIQGIVKTLAFTKYRINQKRYMSIFCKLYNQGSLQLVMDNKQKFTFKEKVGMALNIMKGLSSLHERKIIHRDLGARNYFVHIDKNKNGRKVTAVVADLGRSHHFKGLKVDSSPQGNKYYYSSEMFFPEKMEPRDYTYSDLYATGCVFYRLFYEKKAPWINCKENKNEIHSREKRSRRALQRLERYTNVKRQDLQAKDGNLSNSEKFEKIIFQMIHPEPIARRTAIEHKQALQELYDCL